MVFEGRALFLTSLWLPEGAEQDDFSFTIPQTFEEGSSLPFLAFLSIIHTHPPHLSFFFFFPSRRTHLSLPLPVPRGFVGHSVWPPHHCFLEHRSQE